MLELEQRVALPLAQSALRRGDLLRARELSYQFRTYAPADPQGLLLEAEVALACGETASALSSLADPVLADSKYVQHARVLLAQVYLDQYAHSDVEQALDALSGVMLEPTLAARVQRIVGLLNARRGNIDLAYRAFTLAAVIEPSAQAAIDLAHIRSLRGDHGDALACAQSAITLDRHNPYSYLALYQSACAGGWSRYASECALLAQESATQLLASDPQDIRALLVLAQLALDAAQEQQALTFLSQAIAHRSALRYQAYQMRAQLHLRRSRFELARLDLTLYLGYARSDQSARGQLSLCNLLAGASLTGMLSHLPTLGPDMRLH